MKKKNILLFFKKKIFLKNFLKKIFFLNKNLVDLKNYFEQFGDVLSAYVVKNFATGKSKGFGFVEYFDRDSAQKVIDIQFHEIKGVNVSCSLYLKRGKKYNKEFKELEKKMKKEKFQTKKSKSFQFLDEIDASRSYKSISNHHEDKKIGFKERHPKSHRGSVFYSNTGSVYSSENSSHFNSNSVNSGSNFLLPPPQINPNFGDMNTGINFQNNFNYPQHQNPQLQHQLNNGKILYDSNNVKKNLENSGKRMSLEPYALGGKEVRDFQKSMTFKNRRSLFTEYPGKGPGLPTITVNHCEEDTGLNPYNQFVKSPTSSNYSSEKPDFGQFNQFNQWGVIGKKPQFFDRKFTIGTQQTGDPANQEFQDYGMVFSESENKEKKNFLGGFLTKAEDEIFKGENSLGNSGISVEAGSYENKVIMKDVQGLELLPPPVSPELVKKDGIAKELRTELIKEENNGKKLGEKKEGEKGNDDSFDESMLLKECFKL